MSIGLDWGGGFVCANFIFGGSGRAAARVGRVTQTLELDQVAEGARVGAFEAGLDAMEEGV